jgi:hypothetical protein
MEQPGGMIMQSAVPDSSVLLLSWRLKWRADPCSNALAISPRSDQSYSIDPCTLLESVRFTSLLPKPRRLSVATTGRPPRSVQTSVTSVSVAMQVTSRRPFATDSAEHLNEAPGAGKGRW